jgi:ligand-binding sensor domain-containing protein/signal transduction histidine kinase
LSQSMRLNMKATYPIGFSLLCSLFLGVFAHAQLSPRLQQLRNIAFDHITSERGLPSSAVVSILEDSRGFMWFGTEGGLARYDGHSIVQFRHDEVDSTTIGGAVIAALFEDRENKTLWMGTGKGLDSYDMLTNKFSHFSPDAADEHSISSPFITAICKDHWGKLWIGTTRGLNELVTDSTGRRHFIRCFRDRGDSTSLSSNLVNAICEDDDGTLWVATASGLNRFDRPTKTFRRFYFAPLDDLLWRHNSLFSMTKDRDGLLWLGTPNGLITFDPRSFSFKFLRADSTSLYSRNRGRILKMTIDHSEIHWVATWDGGLYAVDGETGQSICYSHEPNDSRGLAGGALWCVYVDRRGSLWIGTNDAGVDKVDFQKPRFVQLTKNPNNPNSLSDNCVWEMAEDRDGIFWIGTSAGLNRYDRSEGTFTHYVHDPNDPSSISNSIIQTVLLTGDGFLWAGTAAGLNRIDRRTGRIKRFYHEPKPPHPLGDNVITGIYQDAQGRNWLATVGGLMLLNMQERRFEDMPVYGQPHQVLADKDGKTLWVGTANSGLVKFDLKSEAKEYFSHDPRDTTSISHNWILAFCEDIAEPEKFLWVTTWGGGLNKFDKAAGKFTRYTERDGLGDNQIESIVFDTKGFIWLGTMKGLSRFDPRTRTFRNYDARDGLTGGEGNEKSLLRASTGELFVGTMNGVTIFHPDSVRDNPHIPPIVLTDFKITNESVVPGAPGAPLKHTITETKELVLSYLDNMISFEFAALDYVMPEKNQYAYKMDGFDKEWIYSGNVHTATYTNLDPGEYVFRVKGSNNDGLWNEQGASLNIIVSPPYWRTWWLRLIALLTLAALLYALHRYQVSKKLELERMRVRIASDLHDDIGSTLTKIAVQSEVLQTTVDAEKIRAFSGQIGTASREIITTLSDIVWSIDACNDTVGNLLDRMRDFAAEVFTPKQIEYRLTHSGLDTEKRIPVDTRQNIYLIFKEAMNNAARHSNANNVGISLENSSDRFVMTIADDGSGIPENPKHTGHGLRNMQMRAGRIGGNVQVVSDKGTRVILTMKAL